MLEQPKGERRYVAEYLAAFYPDGGWVSNVPLGAVPEEIKAQYGQQRGAALFRPSRPRVDAILSTPGLYILIEAKVREPKMAIGDLLLYRSLAEKTEDLPLFDGQPIGMRLVVPWALDWVRTAATAHGMQLVIYYPKWIEDYVRQRQHYFSAEYREQREEKQRLRKAFGLE